MLNFIWKKFTVSPIFLSKHQAPPIGMCFPYGVRSNQGLRNRILSILLGSIAGGWILPYSTVMANCLVIRFTTAINAQKG